MAFLHIMGSRSIPVAEITAIGREYKPDLDKPGRKRTVYLRDQHDEQITAYEFDLFMAQPRQIMPAQPGTYLIFPFDDYSGTYVRPIIGWALCVSGDVLPLTTDGPYGGPQGMSPVYILHPDGMIDDPHNESWENREEFLAALKARDAEPSAEPDRELPEPAAAPKPIAEDETW